MTQTPCRAAKQLKKARLRRGWSLRAAATVLDTSFGHVRYVENGKYFPGAVLAVRIWQEFSIPVDSWPNLAGLTPVLIAPARKAA